MLEMERAGGSTTRRGDSQVGVLIKARRDESREEIEREPVGESESVF